MSRKILITPEWHPWPEAPAEGSWGREQARAAALSNEVVVLTTRPGRVSPRSEFELTDDLEDELRTVRVRYARHPVPKASLFRRLAAMRLAVRRLRETAFVPELIHAKVFSAGFPSLLLARSLGVPVVVSEHYTGFPRGTLSRWDRQIARWTFRYAARTCPDSADLGTYITQLEPRARVQPMPNVVDTDVFFPAESATPRGSLRILNVASLHDKKGHEHLVAALPAVLAKRPEALLEIAGDGPRRAELERLAEHLGVAESVRFLGLRGRQEVAELMRRADVFVLPSLWENAPHVVIEALASGLPVVATDVGGVSELVDGVDAQLVPAADPGALAAAVLRTSEQSDGRDPHAQAARARERFGQAAVGAQWTTLYEEVVRERSRADSRAATSR